MYDLPRLMRDLVHAAVDEAPDLQLVGEAAGAGALAEVIDSAEPDLLILPADKFELPEAAADAFDQQPALKILVLTGSGEPSFLWELAPWRVSLGDLSPTRLRAALREPRKWTWHS